ncbi:unnamed protein product [Clavelina lepadiformis]|uniref:DDE Tnp4 domain-containing protein n=1 Tax=Clavelina lepadiformis TaxID=159417 RepID=A0ABP0GXW5_CLALP
MKMDGKLFSRTCFHRAASVFFCKELTYAKLSKTPTKELKGCLCSNRHLADSVNLIYLINIQALFDRDGQSFAHVGLSVADLSQFEDPFQVIFDAGFVLSKQPRMKMDGKLFSRTCFHRAASVFFCKELTYAKLSKTPTKELKGCLCSNRHLADSVNLIYLINIQALFDRDGQSFAHVGLSVADLSQFEDPFQVIFDAGFVLSKQPRMKMDGKLFSRTCFHRAASVFFCKELTYAKLSKTPTKELKGCLCSNRHLADSVNLIYLINIQALFDRDGQSFAHVGLSVADLSQFEDPFQVIFDAGFVLSKQPRMKMDGKLFSRTCFHRAASVFFCKELTYAKLSKTPTKELKGCLCSNRHLADSVNLIYLINIQALFDRDGQSFAHVGLSVEFPSSTSDCIHFVAGKPDCKRKPYASQAIVVAVYHGERKKTVDIHSRCDHLAGRLKQLLLRCLADLSQFEDPFQVIFDAGFVLSKQPRMKMDGKLFSRTCFHRAASVFFCKELTYAKLSKTPTKELKEFPSSTSDCIHFVAGKPDCKRKPYASQAIGTADGATKTIVST